MIVKWTIIALGILASCYGTFINYQPGYEYIYDFTSTLDVKTLHKLDAVGEIGLANIWNNSDIQELLLFVHKFRLRKVDVNGHSDPEIVSHHLDFSKWFSFEISRLGEISNVIHPVNEHKDVTAIKNGIVSFLASRLHHPHEVNAPVMGQGDPDKWYYSADDIIKHGIISADYFARKTPRGHTFVKTFNTSDHKIPNGKITSQKNITIHEEIDTIQSVAIEDNFHMHFGPADRFDPYYGMRVVTPVSTFGESNIPAMHAVSKGSLEFVKRRPITVNMSIPVDVITRQLHETVENKGTQLSKADIKQLMKQLQGNLTCMRVEPKRGSPKLANCFRFLTLVVEQLPDKELEKLASHYFQGTKLVRKNQADRNAIVDAIGTIGGEREQKIILDKIFLVKHLDEQLVDRIMTSLLVVQEEPHSELISVILNMCKNGTSPHGERISKSLKELSCLTFGGMVKAMNMYGNPETAETLIEHIHNMVGLHDPWEYRTKRATMSEEETIEHDLNKVTLLDTLGNAGLENSYEYIVSHINTTNSQWIKRSGIFALRHLDNKEIVKELLKAAYFDEHETVRYEAMLAYKAHPLVHSYAVGPELPHHLAKRSFLETVLLDFHLAAPAVDYRKSLGVKALGSSFGVIMQNLLDIYISLLKGNVDIKVHDEAYAKIHIGMINANFDFFIARICFKGGARYDVNILKDLDLELMTKLVTEFKNTVSKIASGIRNGVDAFRMIINGDYTLNDIVEDFIQAIKNIDTYLAELIQKVREIDRKIASVNLKTIPKLHDPIDKFLTSLKQLLEKINEDVMGFINSIQETVHVILPQTSKQVFESITDIIKGFMYLFKDPKTSLFRIGKGVFTIYSSYGLLKETFDEIRNHTFLKKGEGTGPYWTTIVDTVLPELEVLKKDAQEAIKTFASDWVTQETEIDPVATATKGKYTQSMLKQNIVDELEKILEHCLSPLQLFSEVGSGFIQNFVSLFSVVKDIKDAFTTLRKGYEFARSLVDKIFGTTWHKDFPTLRRIEGGGCPNDGFFPSSLGGGKKEYAREGIDVLIEAGENVVVPFTGKIMLSGDPNEVTIEDPEKLPPGAKLYITNIIPIKGIMHPNEDGYEDYLVAAGDVIGTATKSHCTGFNHIHVAITKDGGVVNPTKYIGQPLLSRPKWEQICDDKKYVYMNNVIKNGPLVGLDGRSEENKTVDVPTESPPDEVDDKDKPGKDIQELTSDPKSVYSKVGGEKRGEQSKDTTITKKIGARLGDLMDNIKAFLKRVSIRRVKMGNVIQFLDEFGLDETKVKMADLIKTVKDMVDNKPCIAPSQMSVEDLKIELQSRGVEPAGARSEMINQLTTPDNSCPWITLNMPTDGAMYCTLDDKCMGIECCLTIEVFDLLRSTFKAYVRFDRDSSPPAILFGFGNWSDKIELGFIEQDLEGTFKSGIKLDFLDGNEIVLRYDIKLTATELIMTLQAGLCDTENDECVQMFPILNNAIFPLDGDLSIDTIKSTVIGYLDTSAGVEFLLEQAVDELLERLNIPPELIGDNPPCPMPSNLEHHELVEYLQNKGISTDTVTARNDLEQVYTDSQIACSILGYDISLPDLENPELFFYNISDDCMRIDACIQLTIPNPLSDEGYKKSFNAYVELDACNFVLRMAFEKLEKTVILFGYEWGKFEELSLADNVFITFRIDKDDDKKVFVIDMGVKCDYFEDDSLIEDLEIPIPVCNTNFTLEGKLHNMAAALGGQLNKQVFDLLIDNLGLKQLIVTDGCTVPTRPADCPDSMKIEDLIPDASKNILRCELVDNCFGITCCVDVSFAIPLSTIVMTASMPMWLKLDPCNFSVDIGIGEFYYNDQLLSYQWGTSNAITFANGIVDVRYTVDNYKDGFIVDLKVDVCIPIDDDAFCIPSDGVHLLDNEHIPACDLRALDDIGDFSLDEWLQAKGLEVAADVQDTLEDAGRKALFRLLGIDEFLLSPSCDRTRYPYSPSANGWNNQCPLSFVHLPADSPATLTCHIPDYCTGIECCMDIDVLGISVHAFFDIDLCNYVVSGGIEKLSFNFSLFNYEWGKMETVTIKNVFRIMYSVKKPSNKKVFILTLRVAVCMERDGRCLFDKALLDETTVPQLGCDMSVNMSDFSVSSFLANHGLDSLTPSDDLWSDGISFIMDITGMSKYLQDEPCLKSDVIYTDLVDNWNTECIKINLTLPQLPSFTVCHVSDTCTSFDCCISLDYIKRTLHVSFAVDFCNFNIYGGIENVKFNISVLDYNWGEWKEETILKIIALRYKIQKMAKTFIVDATVTVCFDSKTSCQLDEMKIVKNSVIPIPVCNLDMQFNIKDFSLGTWLHDVGHDIKNSLPYALIDTLLEQLGLKDFLLETQCTHGDDLYVGRFDGWKSECPIEVNLPVLPEEIVCHIPDYCTGLECCVNVNIVRRSVRVKFVIDACSHKVILGIERLEKEISLLNYKFGKIEHFVLAGVFRVDFKLEDLASQKKFIVKMNISVCMEQEECITTIPVFTDAYVPKPLCNWDNGFKIQGYSLSNWLASNNLEMVGDSLEDFVIEQLMNELGIAEYLKDDQCVRGTGDFLWKEDGWNNECPQEIIDVSLPDSMTCHVPDYCTGIECCVDSPVLKRSFHLYLLIDTCSYVLSVGIENYGTKISLLNYEWGTTQILSMFGVVNVIYNIKNLEAEKELLVTMSIAICIESTLCDEEVDIFNNDRIAKQGCNGDFSLQDFDLGTFLQEAGADVASQLQTSVADVLLEKLGVLKFLRKQQCDLQTNVDDNGWFNECTNIDTTDFPKLSDQLQCTISDKCSSIDCCLQIHFIQRSITAFIDIDPCNYKLTVGVDNLSVNISLITYEWGTTNTFSVNGVFVIKFRISELAVKGTYLVDAVVKVCWDSTTCDSTYTLLESAEIRTLPCVWDAGFVDPGFSLANWISTMGMSSTSDFTFVTRDQLISALDIAYLLKSQECNIVDLELDPDKVVMNLTFPNNDSICAKSPSGFHIECCTYTSILNRHFWAEFNMVPCNYTLTAQVENAKYETSLLNYDWGQAHIISIKGVFEFSFMMNNVRTNNEFVLDANIQVCYESSGPCEYVVTLAKNEIISYPRCDNVTDSNGRKPYTGISFDFWRNVSCVPDTTQSGCTNTNFQLPEYIKDTCHIDDDCSAISCCVGFNFGDELRNMLVKFDLQCNSSVDIKIERKIWKKTLVSSPEKFAGKIAEAITVDVYIEPSGANYFGSMNVTLCTGTSVDKHGCGIYPIFSQQKLKTPSCSGRRKRRSISDTISNAKHTVVETIRQLIEAGASSADIEEYLTKVKAAEIDERAKNFNVSQLDESDKSSSYSTIYKALGANNPQSIQHSGSFGSINVDVEGGEAIIAMFDTVDDINGRADSLFVVGKGLSKAGAHLLGTQLAEMTIGDIEAMLQKNKVDPMLIKELVKTFIELARCLFAEVMETFSSPEFLKNAFEAFDITLKGTYTFPRKNSQLFTSIKHTIPIGGIIAVKFEFGASAWYGLDIEFGGKLVSMVAFATAIPYGGVTTYGSVSVGIILYAKLVLEGDILDTKFPTSAEIGFNKFPLDVSLRMDLDLIPTKFSLFGIVTLEINLVFVTIRKTLFEKNLWSYEAPKIRKTVVDVSRKEPDDTPPAITAATKSKRGKRALPGCELRQLVNRDYTDPAFEIAVDAEDDKSNVKLFLDVGTIPGSSDALHNYQLGGAATVISTNTDFLPTGIPLFFTMFAENSAGARASVSCHLESYDVTLPSGRVQGDFQTSSNPYVLKASVLAYDDSVITEAHFGAGYCPGHYGDQVVSWFTVDLKENKRIFQDNEPLSQFSEGREGKLVSDPDFIYTDIPSASKCAQQCLSVTYCTSFNFDYAENPTCELLHVIQYYGVSLSVISVFNYFERHGTGLTQDFAFDNLNLQHNFLYYFNLDLTNNLGYRAILSSEGVLIDLTEPEPGPMLNVILDQKGYQNCEQLIPPDRLDLRRYCVGVNKNILNHRTVIDGEGSMTVFNGDTPLLDERYSRNTFYIAGNWDGFRDNETGILAYTMSVGKAVCEDWIHPHHDPHKHLLQSSQWTHKSIITESSSTGTFPLESGRYYITVRALNRVEYGGPRAITVCHSVPYIIDTTEPVIHEIYDIKYNENKFILSLQHNSSDPESDIARSELCLGKTTRDCMIKMWIVLTESPDVSIQFQFPDGIPVWIRLRVTNNVQLVTVGRSDQAIIVDTSPPIPGEVNDGTTFREDMQYTKYSDQICANWNGFYDLQSGITSYAIGAGTSPGAVDVADLKDIKKTTYQYCVRLNETQALVHGNVYYIVLWAYNGGFNQLNTSVKSSGVRVDLTKPVLGDVIDGNDADFTNLQFSSSPSTVQLQWRNFLDPESGIREYAARVWRQRRDKTLDMIKPWETFARTNNKAEWRNFNLQHRDIVKSELKATNGALNDVETETSGFIVDLTPPAVQYINDGLVAGTDINFQFNTTALLVNFKFFDPESGIESIRLQVHKMQQGMKHPFYPGNGEDWLTIDTNINEYSLTDITSPLTVGHIYYVRMAVGNGAGLISTVDTDGVLVDDTPPMMHKFYVGVLSGVEEIVEGFVWQSDHNGIKASWISNDPESGINAVQISVGTSPGNTDVLDWIQIGAVDTNTYLHVSLSDTDLSLNLPVYYVGVRVQNGAGLWSNVAVSTPIIVVPEDVAGLIYDGPYETFEDDLDYQADSNTATMKFLDFASSLHGLKGYDWAIGTSPGEEDVQPYIEYAIQHEEEYDDTEHGFSSSGLAHMSIDLDPSNTYFTTLRVITNAGNVLQVTTDGIVIDTTSPHAYIDRIGPVEGPEQIETVYQVDEWVTADWSYHDDEILNDGVNDNIKSTIFFVGSYPYSEGFYSMTNVNVTPVYTGDITVGKINISQPGKPNIVSLNVKNKAELETTVFSAALVQDISEPNAGTIICPSFVQSHSPIECAWFGFTDKESEIVEYSIEFGSKQGFNDINEAISLPQNYSSYIAHDIAKGHTDTLYATLNAVNSVGMKNRAFSQAIFVDDTPPVAGVVVELSSSSKIYPQTSTKTVEFNRRACTSASECELIDAVCIESLERLNIAWTLFSDPESEITEYQLAVGTTPGGAQVLPYFSVSRTLNQYTITGLNLNGFRQVFATVKAVNFAGLATSATSDGVYISYLSQGLPPIGHVGIYDAHQLAVGDVQYQLNKNSIEAGWDTSGDPCPAVNYEWAIEQTDGELVQDFLDVGTSEYEINNQVALEEGVRYYNLLRVTNMIGFTYTLRSDGVTINTNALIPGFVYDGDVTGYDLTFQQSRSSVTANWDGFGAPKVDADIQDILTGNAGVEVETDDNQGVTYYMVALGTDRRFPKTRDNIVPFTNVWRNTSVTFMDLSLEPGHAVYYFTVIGYSESYSYATAISNGFYVHFNGGVKNGKILMQDYIDSDSQIDVRWEGYISEVKILVYYVAISSVVKESSVDCRKYADGGHATPGQMTQVFDVSPVTNIGVSTYVKIEDLDLSQNGTYYVWVLALDKAGECNMSYHKFSVDITAPETGQITGGLFYGMLLAYTLSDKSITVQWDGFVDYDSGIDVYNVTLWFKGTCGNDLVGSGVNTTVTSVMVFSNYTQYTFTNLTIVKSTVYYVTLVAINRAGLKSYGSTSPIVFDDSLPTAGHISEGSKFTEDVVWWGSTDHMIGSLLHYPLSSGEPCPTRRISMQDSEWTAANFSKITNQTGQPWHLNIRSINVKFDDYRESLTLKIMRDSKTDEIFSGAYIRNADMSDEGSYQLSISSANGDGKAVTGITFFDGEISEFIMYTIASPDSWTEDTCVCCFSDVIPSECTCDCTTYLARQSTDTTTSSTEYTPIVISPNNESQRDLPKAACGLQLHAGKTPYAITWCAFTDPSSEMMSVSTDLLFDPSASYHDYKINFHSMHESIEKTYCIRSYADGAKITEMCGIPKLSQSTKLVLHVWNKDNYLPDIDVYNLWESSASFKQLVMPPHPSALCRYGDVFRGGNIAVVKYEAGIGTNKHSDDIVSFREVYSPCIPCTDQCSRYVCDKSCSTESYEFVPFSLTDLDLTSATNRSLYILVKAVLGSSVEVTESSNGFYIDLTPPMFDEDVLFYIDVNLGEFRPSEFQGSNSTIKAVWYCSDDDSEIQEYQWAIGTYIGATDIQTFTTTGTNSSGTNSNLEGLLLNNSTYYVSVICENEAGLKTEFSDTTGVMVLTEPPDPESFEVSAVNAEEFDYEIYPATSKKTDDPTSCGESWGASTDPNVARYDFCIGSTKHVIDDVLPCVWIATNTSGIVEVKSGKLWVNNIALYNISELRALSEGIFSYNEFEVETHTSNNFHMEPGRTLFLYMKICNKAYICNTKLSNTLLISSDSTVTLHSTNGAAASKKINQRRSKRSTNEGALLQIDIPPGMADGQTIAINQLSADDYNVEYTSAASTVFTTYITNPANTSNNAERRLKKRIISFDDVFTVTAVGQEALPGYLKIKHYQTNVNASGDKHMFLLIHWNPELAQWQISSRSCGDETNHTLHSATDSTTTVDVCNTRSDPLVVWDVNDTNGYFSKETQFAVAVVYVKLINTAPYINGSKVFYAEEDSEEAMFQLEAVDDDGDEITFQVEDLRNYEILSSVLLTKNGTLTIVPCVECYGSATLTIRLTDFPAYEDIESAYNIEEITIVVSSVNDPPSIHLLDYDWEDMLHTDRTDTVYVYREERKDDNSTVIIDIGFVVAYDIDGPQDLKIGYDFNTTVVDFELIPLSRDEMLQNTKCSDYKCHGTPALGDLNRMDWVGYRLMFMYNGTYVGLETIKLVAQDNMTTFSDVLTLTVVVMENKCKNSGSCKSKHPQEYSCNDVRRTESFDLYYSCQCTSYWTGRYCIDDIDECDNSPCEEYQLCRNVIGNYECYCDNFICNMGLKTWSFALVIVSCVLFIFGVIIVLVCIRNCKKKNNSCNEKPTFPMTTLAPSPHRRDKEMATNQPETFRSNEQVQTLQAETDTEHLNECAEITVIMEEIPANLDIATPRNMNIESKCQMETGEQDTSDNYV